MRIIRSIAGAAAMLALTLASTARAQRPADVLLKLVPPDAGATVVIEDLRTHGPEIRDSALAAGLKRLPVVQDWLASDRYQKFQQAQAEIEHALEVPLGTLRDRLLGDAVVLAMNVTSDDAPDNANGLVLVRFRDRVLLDRLLERLNEHEKQEGTLVGVAAGGTRQASYWVRRFRPDSKPNEYYAIVGEDVFAWSNSEAAIQGVLARKAGAPGLGDEPKFRKVRDRLPPGALVSLFVNPRYLERMKAAESKPQTPAEERVSDLLARNLAAIDYAGAALEWRDGFLLQTHETLDPEKLDESFRRWAQRHTGSASPLIDRVPPGALALAAGRLDFSAIFDTLTSLVPEADSLSLENTLTVARGLLMGKDVRKEVLPFVGPSVLMYMDAPVSGQGPEARPPLVLVLNLGGEAGERGVAGAIDNALRTLMAIYAGEPKRKDARLRVESRDQNGLRLTTLAGDRTVCAYAIDERGILVLGTSTEAVVGYCSGQSQANATSRFARFRAAYFPEAGSFAFADLPRLYETADTHRDTLARRLAARHNRPEEAARHDLDQALDFIHLFQGAFVTSTIDAGFTSIHRSIGLIARDPAPLGSTALPKGRGR